jgi:hypothetical protein
MSHDAKPNPETVGNAEKQATSQDSLLEILSLWANSLAGVNHTLATAQDFLTALSRDQHADSEKLDSIEKSVTSLQVRLEQVASNTQNRCKEALKEFTKFKGAWGKVQWFLREHQEHPRAVWSAFAMMVFTAGLATLLGLDMQQLFSRLAALTGWGP